MWNNSLRYNGMCRNVNIYFFLYSDEHRYKGQIGNGNLSQVNQQKAIESFTALAQESRLAVYRLLVREQPNGLPVGEISRRLDIIPSTLSGHLGVLRRVGLLRSTRHQREIHYAAKLEAMGDLIHFMLEDCCDGQVSNCDEILSLMPSGKSAQTV